MGDVSHATNPLRQRGARIRALRETAGLSTRELAEHVDIHPQSLRNIELEKRPASPAVLESIALALRVDVAEITLNGTQKDTTLGSAPEQPSAAPAEPTPYRLYTCTEAALRLGTGITANLLRRLAAAGTDHTRIGGKIRWTEAQLAALVAAHATAPETDAEPVPAPHTAPAPRRSTGRRRSSSPRTGDDDLAAKPGRRYATA
ncbi:helix-turn-helix domain-containing protein [Streptosporangium saharense]|uniref:helix-turn-helix domain-containing protein n=1 Tax=Streptosporangium saharense TaxID=1706840 RepID=UPI003684B940